jgi:hypothetical protein
VHLPHQLDDPQDQCTTDAVPPCHSLTMVSVRVQPPSQQLRGDLHRKTCNPRGETLACCPSPERLKPFNEFPGRQVELDYGALYRSCGTQACSSQLRLQAQSFLVVGTDDRLVDTAVDSTASSPDDLALALVVNDPTIAEPSTDDIGEWTCHPAG